MPVEDVAARVTEVLSRAESLFVAAPENGGSAAATGPIGAAAAATRAVAPRTSELSGAMATTHGEAVSATADRLERVADAERDLAHHLSQATDTHRQGQSQASSLRAGVAEIPAALGPAAQIPAGQIAALKALRNRVARMNDLVTQHSAGSAQLAEEIRNLKYRT
jgi:hypothetical protein